MEISEYLLKEEIKLFAKQLVKDTSEKHFAQQHANLQYNINFIESVAKNNAIPNYPATGTALVFKVDEQPVAFAIICSSVVPQFGSELLFFTTLSEHRRKGYASKSIQLIRSEVKGISILARCMPSSKPMINLLKKSGFSDVKLPRSKNTNLMHPNG